MIPYRDTPGSTTPGTTGGGVRAQGEGGANTPLADALYGRLLRDRVIFLGQEVDDDIANRITGQLLLLAAQSEEDIHLYINSPGGSVTAGMAIYDTMQYVKPDVVTIGLGLAASMGQFLLTAGAPGKRFALPHATILMHQPSAGLAGSATDIRIYAEQLRLAKSRMARLIAHHSGHTVEEITADFDRDRWFDAEEAKEYGLVDDVLDTATTLPGSDRPVPAPIGG